MYQRDKLKAECLADFFSVLSNVTSEHVKKTLNIRFPSLWSSDGFIATFILRPKEYFFLTNKSKFNCACAFLDASKGM